ncbi:MAG: hypothetical protein HFJ32_04605 [Clostridia bacterium]|nr:hypothetical protein [Clostridia bacterium]
MANILVANQNVQQNIRLCNYLTNDKLKVIGLTDEISTLEKYYEIRPDIFILNTNLNYIEIIDKLSSDKFEKRICNTILVPNNSDTPLCTNTAKVYHLFDKPPKMQEISDVVLEMSQFTLEEQIDMLFFTTKISASNGANYIKSALLKCLYQPELLKDLNSIFASVAKDYHTNSEVIRSSFRTALIPVNLYKEKNPPFAIFRLFEKDERITPKKFLEAATTYLRMTKNKKISF